jgi:D-apiose dehydrogenase
MTRTIGVSGLGSIGRQHADAFRSIPDVRVVAFEPAPALRESALAEGRADVVHATFPALLAERPDAIVIAAPDPAHLAQLGDATAAGIPVLVEKPLATDAASAAAALPGLEATGTPVVVGYVLRHRRAVQRSRALVADGAIGEPVSFQILLGAYGTITAAANRFATPEPDRLYRDYSHEWDYLRWILGPVREVLAVARTTPAVPHVESPNLVDALLVLESGVVGAVHLDYVEPAGTRLLTIVGTEGILMTDVARGRVTVRRAGADDAVEDLAEPPSAPLTRQAAHLLAVADGREAPVAGLRDGLAALEVAAALIRSAPGRTWEKVS